MAKTLLKERFSVGRLFTIEIEGASAGVVPNSWMATQGPCATIWPSTMVEEIAKSRREVDDADSQP